MPRPVTNLDQDNYTNAELRTIMQKRNLSAPGIVELLEETPYSMEVSLSTVRSWLRSPATVGYRSLPPNMLNVIKDKLRLQRN